MTNLAEVAYCEAERLPVEALAGVLVMAIRLLADRGAATAEQLSILRTLEDAKKITVNDLKQCSKCDERKERSEFSKRARSKDGLSSACKMCNAQYYQAHREEKAQYNAQYYQDHRDEIAACHTERREKNAAYYKTYRVEHREERATYNRTWYAKHREDRLAYCAAWRKSNLGARRAYEHHRRSRKATVGGAHTATDIKRQGDCQEWKCWWCSKPCADEYHVDHLVPLAKSGHNDPSNIVVACPHCNLSKHDKTPDEFAGRLL